MTGPIRTRLPGLTLPLLALASACGGTSSDAAGTPPPQTPAAIAEYLAAHNTVRASASPTPSPSLAPLAWSSSAEAAAWSWATRCVWAHDPALGSLGMGQNLAAGQPPGRFSITGLVNTWAAEAASYDYATNSCSGVCGHYTQIVWRTTTSVGCVLHTCSGGTPPPGWTGSWDFLVCNYVPPGNVVGQRPY